MKNLMIHFLIGSCLYNLSAMAYDRPCFSELISTVRCEGTLVDHPEYRALLDFDVIKMHQKPGHAKVCKQDGGTFPTTGNLPLVIGKNPVIDTILEAEFANFVLSGETEPGCAVDTRRKIGIFRRPIILNGPVTHVGLIEVAYDKDSEISFGIDLNEEPL